MARTTATEWAKRVARWQRSGESAAAFGAGEGFPGKQLLWWRWHLARQGAPQAPALVPVHIVHRAAERTIESPPSPIEIVLTSGVQLRVTGGVDEETLARVVRALEATCC